MLGTDPDKPLGGLPSAIGQVESRTVFTANTSAGTYNHQVMLDIVDDVIHVSWKNVSRGLQVASLIPSSGRGTSIADTDQLA